MLLAACFLLFASFNREIRDELILISEPEGKGGQANSEQQEATISQIQLEDNVSLIHIFISNP